MKKPNVAIMGATGAVGVELIELLEERDFPLNSLKLLASARSVGKKMTFRGEEIIVEELTHDCFEGVDIVLASAGGSISKEYAPSAVKAGAVVVSGAAIGIFATGVQKTINNQIIKAESDAAISYFSDTEAATDFNEVTLTGDNSDESTE